MSQLTVKRSDLLKEIIDNLDLPESVEKKVIDRYYSLGEWFNRDESSLKDVVIFVQGSFGQGTTIKPLSEDEDYDLDMSCKVNVVDFKLKYTQEDLMEMVKQELELYRKSVGIQTPIEEKRRCLRLYYKDEVPFHLDFVPSIPLEDKKTFEYHNALSELYVRDEKFVTNLAKLAVNIPDKEDENYNSIDSDWHISNQQGYLLWFQSKMRTTEQKVYKASIESLPEYKNKSILQRSIQLLKRHRDTMFSDKESKACKPISIIITTLAARAYQDEQSLEDALSNILSLMPTFINENGPRVSNPVKPEEDFTDKWDTPEGKNLDLEGNFYRWLRQAQIDIENLLKTTSYKTADTILRNNFSVNIDKSSLINRFHFKDEQRNIITNLPPDPPKLWGDSY